MSEEWLFQKLKEMGRKCNDCGDPDIVTVSLPAPDGEPFRLDEIGKMCFCRRCAMLRFLTKGRA